MGYYVYITRAKHWLENEDCKIPEKTWDDYVDDDPSLWVGPESMNGDEDVPMWIDHPRCDEIPIWYEAGNICAKNPDRPTIEKLIEIADALNAQVQGEEGEVYSGDSPEPYYFEPTPTERISGAFGNLYWRAQMVFQRSHTERKSHSYKLGDRVRDIHQREGTVVELGHQTEMLPTVTVQFDNGQLLKILDDESFLEPVESQSDEAGQT
jgi:hypothetical protein